MVGTSSRYGDLAVGQTLDTGNTYNWGDTLYINHVRSAIDYPCVSIPVFCCNKMEWIPKKGRRVRSGGEARILSFHAIRVLLI